MGYEISPEPVLAIAAPKEMTCATSAAVVGPLSTNMVTAADMDQTRKAAPPGQTLDAQ